VQSDIVKTWLGMVGPGVQAVGVDSETWSDHTDIRPTMLTLLGLTDDYAHEGRLLVEELDGFAVPSAVHKGEGIFRQLARALKRIDAPVGPLGLASLSISTTALKSNDAGDATYIQLENQLISFTTRRDQLAAQMLSLLENAEFFGQPIDQKQGLDLVKQADELLAEVNTLAGNP